MADLAPNLTILEQLGREFEAAHRNREQAMARVPLFPGAGGHSALSTHSRNFFGIAALPAISAPSSPPPAGWEFAEHPTDALIKKLVWNLLTLNLGDFARTIADSERQRQAVKALQRELDRTSGFVSTSGPGPGDSSLMLREELSPLRARLRGLNLATPPSQSTSSPGIDEGRR